MIKALLVVYYVSGIVSIITVASYIKKKLHPVGRIIPVTSYIKKKTKPVKRKGMPCEECKHLICLYNGGNSINCDVAELHGCSHMIYCGRFESKDSNEDSEIGEEFFR